jgi:hypothetical protein
MLGLGLSFIAVLNTIPVLGIYGPGLGLYFIGGDINIIFMTLEG